MDTVMDSLEEDDYDERVQQHEQQFKEFISDMSFGQVLSAYDTFNRRRRRLEALRVSMAGLIAPTGDTEVDEMFCELITRIHTYESVAGEMVRAETGNSEQWVAKARKKQRRRRMQDDSNAE